jgi:16S rRNA (guanine527-N7)-methyltransferase
VQSGDQTLEAVIRRYGLPPTVGPPLEALLLRLARTEAPTAIHDARVSLDVHIADSLAGLHVPEVRAARFIADVGSGAGLPGLVLAAAVPDAQIHLVEAAKRKCEFLRATVSAMRLSNVRVESTRAETWVEGLDRCDVVCARAVAALPVLCEYAAPLLRHDGVLVAWKGSVPESEAADGVAAAAHLGLRAEAVRPVVPFPGSERRTLHVFRKVKPTPAEYPRRAGVATKRPLSARNVR